jgi:nonsense-mediated mRNA decay protein 3
MSESRAFCPQCGDPIELRAGTGADAGVEGETGAGAGATNGRTPICDACFFEAFDLVEVPERIEVPVCSRCGAVKRGNRWVDVGARDYTDVAIDEVAKALQVHVDATDVSWGVDPEQVDENTIRMHCAVAGAVRGRFRETEVTVPVLIARGTCDRCGRIAGKDYAATVQVRARERTPADDEQTAATEIAQSYIADREAAGDRNAYITEITERPEGLDIRVSTTQIGQAIADRVVRRFGGHIDHSRTLVSEDGDGSEVYRMAYAIRLPPFRPGDVIDITPATESDDPVVVESVRGNLKGTHLSDGEGYEADSEDGTAPDATVLGSVEDATRATLVAVEDERAIQVLDPETYESKTVRRPAGISPEDDQVPVLKAGGEVYPLPDGVGPDEPISDQN